MSRLTVYADTNPGTPTLVTGDPVAIAAALAPIGVRFERWDSPVALAPDAESAAVLVAYQPYLDTLMNPSGVAGGGAGSADVLRMTPDNPAAPALRTKFLSEHIHTEDEVRFFVDGAGSFVLHIDGQVFDAYCTAGDLISVPAGTKHWFDAGPSPRFTALRVFQDTTGWTPHFTGDAIAERFPVA